MMYRSPAFYRWLFPNLLWRLPGQGRTLYLTFDDGPIPGPTEFVLDTLRQWQIKATFFLIGDNIRKHPGVFQRIIREGHAVGNHTFNHLDGWKTGAQKYAENVEACRRQMDVSGKEKTLYFRPPYGKITPGQVKLLQQYRIVMWDLLTNDFRKELKPEICLANTLRRLRPGAIIVMHDSLKAETNLSYVLPRLLEEAKKQNYVFKRLDEA